MKENKLAHIIMEILKEEEIVGGLQSAALVNRVLAKHVKESLPVPPAEAVQQAILDLVLSEVVYRDSNSRLRVKSTQAGKPQATPWAGQHKDMDDADLINPSGMYPIGTGDMLYNLAGEPVARVTGLKRLSSIGVDGLACMQVEMDVEPLFTSFYSKWGDTIPGAGEVISGKNTSDYQKQMMTTWDFATYDAGFSRPKKRVRK